MNLRKFVKTEYFFLLILLAVSFAIIFPVFIKGIPFGYDLPHHFQCAQTFVDSIRNGDFYPSWSLNRNYGFGGMESRLYPPISHYSLALAYLLFNDWHLASWATFTFFTFLGGLGVYLWAKEYLPSSQAVFAGSIYILLPYHLNQLYNTFFYAEYVGSCVLPFSFYFLSRVCRRGKTSDVVGLIISYAVLILTHLPLTVIGSICLGIYGLTLLKKENFLSQITKSGLGVLGGLAASSFFWTKVLLERDLMAKTLIYADPWLDYRLHFLLTPIQTFEGELRQRIYETATFYYDLMFLYTVILALACTIPFFISDKRSKFSMKGVWLIFGISVFLILPFSKFIWDALPFLQEVQFPWRWIAVVCIFAPMLSASQLHLLIEWFRDSKRPFALIICGSILAVMAFSLSQIVRQAPYIEKATAQNTIEKDINDIGFTFWWTIWTRKEGFDNKEKVTIENRNVQINNWTATTREFQVSEGNPTTARIATFYHPNWKATVNEGIVEIKPDENGAILIPLTSQKSIVKLIFVEPQSVQIGDWTSLGIWLLLFIYLFNSFRLKIKVKTIDSGFNFDSLLNQLKSVESLHFHFPVLALTSFLSILPTFIFGVFHGVDLSQHVQFSSTFYTSILAGDFYPSWAADENLGFGGIGVRFYPPLVPLFFALLKMIFHDWHTTTWVFFFLFNFVGSLGVYLWAKEYLETKYALWAGIFFVLMPYHIYQIQNGSQFAEFAGCSVIPFSFLFVTRICSRNKFSDVFGLAVSFSILIFTHLPTTVIGSLSLLIYSLIIIPKDNFFAKLLRLSISVLLGLLSSSVYWVKMITELKFLRNTSQDTTHFFDYSFNFLLTSPWFEEKQLWFLNLIFITIFLILIFSGAIIFFFDRTGLNNKLRGIFAVFFLTLVMCLVISKPIWMAIPFLPEVQFPWRWLTIASPIGAILLASSLSSFVFVTKINESSRNFIKVFLGLFLLLQLFIFGTIWAGFQLNYIPKNEFNSWVDQKSSELGAEWFWTIHTKEEAFRITDKIVANGRDTEIQSWKPDERIFTVEQGNATDVRVATLFYPLWKATLHQNPVEVKLADDGAILIPVTAEKSQIRLWFEEPARVKISTIVSKITWVIFIILGLLLGIGKFSKKENLSNSSELKTF